MFHSIFIKHNQKSWRTSIRKKWPKSGILSFAYGGIKYVMYRELEIFVSKLDLKTISHFLLSKDSSPDKSFLARFAYTYFKAVCV